MNVFRGSRRARIAAAPVALLVLAAGCNGQETTDVPAPEVEDQEPEAPEEDAASPDDDAPADDVEAEGDRCTAPPGNARILVHDEEADSWDWEYVETPIDLVEVTLELDGDDFIVTFTHAEELDWDDDDLRAQELFWLVETAHDDEPGPRLRASAFQGEWSGQFVPDPGADTPELLDTTIDVEAEGRIVTATFSLDDVHLEVPFYWEAIARVMIPVEGHGTFAASSHCPDRELTDVLPLVDRTDDLPRFTG